MLSKFWQATIKQHIMLDLFLDTKRKTKFYKQKVESLLGVSSLSSKLSELPAY